MWLWLLPVIIAEILFWIALIYAAWRAYRAFSYRKWPSIAIWMGLITLPFVFYFYKHIEADAQEIARADTIAALPRATVAQTYPKLLEVYGHATEFELLIFLDVLKFDEVAVLQRPRQCNIYGQFVTLSPGCEETGIEHLETWKKRGRFGAPTKTDKDCLISVWKTVSEKRAAIPAVEYRHGTQSTLVPPGNNWSSGAYELRVRTTDGTKLIDYWERPFITRPAWPGPWGYAFPSNTDRKKYNQPKRLDFILKAIDDTWPSYASR